MGISGALVLGDAAVLLAFCAGGIAFHDTPGSWPLELARIGFPFVLGYYLCAHLTGALLWEPDGRRFSSRTLLAWLTGVGLGILLRVVLEGRFPMPTFVVVTYLFTGALLSLWRAAYWRSNKEKGPVGTGPL